MVCLLKNHIKFLLREPYTAPFFFEKEFPQLLVESDIE